MNRIYAFFLLLTVVGLAACGNTSAPGPPPLTAADPPNVLLIVADDLGWADLNCYGNPLVLSPNLDRLARAGVQFMQAYAAAPTGRPSRFALQTGQYPARNPETDLRKAPETLGELAHRASLRTAHLGRWGLGDGPNAPQAHGYGRTFAVADGRPDSYHHPFFTDAPVADLLAESQPGDYLPDKLTDHALTLLDGWRDSTWLMSLNYYAPHTPIDGREDRVSAYYELIDSTHWRRFPNPHYAAMITAIDDNVGRLVDFLERSDQLDNTLIVFTSDNGGLTEKLEGRPGQHTPPTDNGLLRGGKGSLYEGGIRVPLIVHFPGYATTTFASLEPVIGTDVYATIAAALGGGTVVPNPDAQSLLPVLRGVDLPRRTLFWRTPTAHAARREDVKLYVDAATDSLTYFRLSDLPDESRAMKRVPDGSGLERDLRRWLRVMRR